MKLNSHAEDDGQAQRREQILESRGRGHHENLQ